MTPLSSLGGLEPDLNGVSLQVKLETNRFGLPSFKFLGASWAAVQALRPLLPAEWTPADGLASLRGTLPDRVLVAPTDGNHGRSIAHIARLIGLGARIYVPDGLAEGPIKSILNEGAEVVQVAGSYDDAVRLAATESKVPNQVLISDTSWKGYEKIPCAVIDGYGTILHEVDRQLADQGRPSPDLVIVQMGVGAFAAAVIRHYRNQPGPAPRFVGVEPSRAACVAASLAAGRRVEVPGPHDSVMAGLNCGIPSLVAWPVLQHGLDGVLIIDDADAVDGVRRFAADGFDVGACSGAGLSAARLLLADVTARPLLQHLKLPDNPSVLIFATEGITDPEQFAAAVTAPVHRNTGSSADRRDPATRPRTNTA